MAKLLFLGSTCADVILRTPRLPHTGDDLSLLGQSVSLGGCAYNAFAAARLFESADCGLFSPVGTGVWGDWVAKALADRGVVSMLPRAAEPNGCCYCLVDDIGERTFLCEHGAEYRFASAWMAMLGDEVYDGVYLCGLEVEEPSGEVLLDYLEAHPPRRLYFAPGPRLCHIPPARMARVFALHPVIHINAAEAEQFTREATVANGAAALSELTGNDVVITLGSDGVYVVQHGRCRCVPSWKVRVQDTIGAGDAHLGAIMACEAQGMCLEDAVLYANRAAAAVVSQEGAELPRAVFQQWMEEAGLWDSRK